MHPDPPHQPAHMRAYFLASGGFAGTEDGLHAMAGRRLVDVDWHEHPLVVVGVEERHLLMAVHRIGGIVDIVGDGLRWLSVALAPEIDHAL